MSLTVTLLLLCLSPGQRHFSSPGLSLFPLLSSTLPGPSASEVTILWRYINAFITIIITIIKRQTAQHSASESRGTQGRESSTVCSRGNEQVYGTGGCTE